MPGNIDIVSLTTILSRVVMHPMSSTNKNQMRAPMLPRYLSTFPLNRIVIGTVVIANKSTHSGVAVPTLCRLDTPLTREHSCMHAYLIWLVRARVCVSVRACACPTVFICPRDRALPINSQSHYRRAETNKITIILRCVVDGVVLI